MFDLLLAAAAYIILIWVPGAAVCDLVRPDGGWIRNAAVAPVVGVGLAVITADLWRPLGVPLRPWSVLPVSALVPSAAWIYLSLRRKRLQGTGRRMRGRVQQIDVSRLDVLVLAAAAVVGLVVWAWAIRSTGAVIPNSDGSHHGLFAERILRSGSLDPNQVQRSDLADKNQRGVYYPLALHLIAALLAAVTGAPVNAVLTVGLVLAAVVVLPLGMFVLVRRLCPEAPLVADAAAWLSVLLTWIPYGPIIWGGMPTIVAMAQVPAVVDAVWRRATDGRVIASGALAGVAGYAIFQEHNSELVTVALFAFLVGAAAMRKMDAPSRRPLFLHWVVATVVILLLIAPHTRELVSSANARSSDLGNAGVGAKARGTGTLPTLIPGSGGHVASLIFSPVIALLAAAGFVISVPRKWCPGLGWFLAAVLALFAGTLSKIPVLTTLTLPWYRAALRVSYMLSYPEVIYGAVGVAMIATGLGKAWARPRPPAVRRRTVAVLALLGVGVAAAELPQSMYLARLGYRQSSLVNADQRSGFAWLSHHVRPGQRVLNQFTDGSGWMAVLTHVTPLFATTPDDGNDPAAMWGERLYLLNHASSLATNAQARKAVNDWRVAYAYVNSRIFGGNRRRLTEKALSSSSAYREVWHRGGVSIFEVVSP